MQKLPAWAGFLSTLFLLVLPASAAEPSLEKWIQNQTDRSLSSLYAAISPSDGARGAVMASPSKNNPDYYAHWIRDASLVMREVWAYRIFSKNLAHETMKDFAIFSRRNQTTPNRSGEADARGLGEPKFEIDGSPYEASWGRPQNDGPALRVLALLGLADELMMSGNQEFVERVLYRLEMPARTVIKADLEYIAHHWMDPSFDLWEEVMGDHFYTRIAQWRALEEGSRFAYKMGDPNAADFYREQAGHIYQSLNNFWSNSRNYILTTRNQVDGVNDKTSNLDIAIILGVLHSGKPGFSYYVDDDRVIATAFALEQTFGNIYSINQQKTDHFGQPMAPGIGRYPEDRYDGYGTNGRGNPWFLSTQALAEFHLRLKGAISANRLLRITEVSRPFFEALLNQSLADVSALTEGDRAYDEIIFALQEKSDAFIRRARYHTEKSGAQSEQFNRENGYMQGANDLTWSYASFLSLQRIRERNYD